MRKSSKHPFGAREGLAIEFKEASSALPKNPTICKFMIQIARYATKSGRWLGSEITENKSNEIPAAQRLLARKNLQGQRVTMDALHTQHKTARIVVQEGGGRLPHERKGQSAWNC